MYELAKLSYVLNFHDYYNVFFQKIQTIILMITFIINDGLTLFVNHDKLGEC
jgi:hypothetical protein